MRGEVCGENNTNYFTGLLKDLNNLTHEKHIAVVTHRKWSIYIDDDDD